MIDVNEFELKVNDKIMQEIEVLNKLDHESKIAFINECLQSDKVLNFLSTMNSLEEQDQIIMIEIDRYMFYMPTYWQVIGLPEKCYQFPEREMSTTPLYYDDPVMMTEENAEITNLELLYLIKNDYIILYQCVQVAGSCFRDN